MLRGIGRCIMQCALFLCLLTSSAFAASIALLQPSQEESVFAPLRDFMVIGTVEGVDRPVSVRIELYDHSGKLLRLMENRVDLSFGPADEETIALDYKNGKYYKEDQYAALKNNPPPDLLLDEHGNANNPAAKILLNREKQFAAVILGGVSKAFDTDYKDAVLGAYQDLNAGKYRLKITALDAQTREAVAVCERKLTFAPSNMVFGRFSPTAEDGYPHKEELLGFAKENKLHVLLDAVPGYWNQSRMASGEAVFYEIPARWRLNDLKEYVEAKNIYGVMYNIASFSTTQTLEIGGLLRKNYLEDGSPGRHVYLYRYDIGEPEMVLRGERGDTYKRQGKIVPFDGKKKSAGYDRLVFVRAEIRDANVLTADNDYWPYQLEKTADFALDDGVRANMGQTVSFYGVAAPLPTDEINLVTEGDVKERVLRYDVQNRIRQIAYKVTMPSGQTMRIVKPIQLKRHYFEKRSSVSVYEWKHDFARDVFNCPGSYVLEAQGIDAHGNSVDRARQSLRVEIANDSL